MNWKTRSIIAAALLAAALKTQGTPAAEQGTSVTGSTVQVEQKKDATPQAASEDKGSAANGPGLVSAITAEEPLLDQFSPMKAAEFLDAKWQVNDKNCLSCHGTYSYLLVRPLVESSRTTYREARRALENGVVKQASQEARSDMAGMPVANAVMGAATLAQHDAPTGKLQPLTREALDRMWKLQRDDGHWKWVGANEVPSAIDDHFGATMAAIAAGAAPENYADTPQARQGIAKLRDYFRNHPPRNLHHRTLLLLASHHLRELVTEADRQQTVADLWALQRPDGGWAMGALGNWKRKDGKPQNLVDSDGYGTGLVTYVLRTAGGIAADDARLSKAVAWLKTHQRASGGWYTYSPTKDDRLSSYVGTVYALLALDACGEIRRPADPVP